MIYGKAHPIKAIVMSQRISAQKHGIFDNVPKVLFVYAMNSIKVLPILFSAPTKLSCGNFPPDTLHTTPRR